MYVGAGKCKQCHKGIYEGWKSTLLGLEIAPIIL